jgi:hypothetical protein
MNIDIPALEKRTEADACRKLWYQVLSQAVRDIKYLKDTPSTSRVEDKLTACRYLLSGEHDDQVAFSGFDPAWVRKAIFKNAIKGEVPVMKTKDGRLVPNEENNWRNSRRSIMNYLKTHTHNPVCDDARKSLDEFLDFMKLHSRGR